MTDLERNVEHFKKVTSELAEIYRKKNHDYGDSFTIVVKDLGDVVALGQVSFKFHRLRQLIKGVKALVNESIKDSIQDMANYLIMWLMIIDERENGNQDEH